MAGVDRDETVQEITDYKFSTAVGRAERASEVAKMLQVLVPTRPP
jgi:hypothetical protein